MTDMPNAATPRSVRDTLRKAYKETTYFEGSLYSALFAALKMLEKMEARIAALEAARSAPAPKVLYEGEASVLRLRDGLLLLTPGAMTILSVQKRVHVVVTAAEGDES